MELLVEKMHLMHLILQHVEILNGDELGLQLAGHLAGTSVFLRSA